MIQRHKPNKINLIFLFAISFCFLLTSSASGCLEFSSGSCIRCEPAYHLFNDRCFLNIIGCLRYQNGSSCVLCDTSFSQLNDGKCTFTSNPNDQDLQQKMQQIYLYDGREGEQYGQSSFRPISIQEARNMMTFQILDQHFRTGEHRHRISMTQEPVFSVSTYRRNDQDSFKILYDGTGGAVVMCIGDVNINTFQVRVRSIVVISVHQLVDYCSSYDAFQKCERCMQGYHLQGGRCYLSIGKCTSYKKNICLRCDDWHLLVENRCVSDCASLSDTRSVDYFHNEKQSSFELAYGRENLNTSKPTKQEQGSGSQILILDIKLQTVSSQKIIEKSSTTTTTETSTTTITNTADPNCYEYNDDKRTCKKCVPYFFLNKQNVCEAVSPFCKIYNESDGTCIECYEGFEDRCE